MRSIFNPRERFQVKVHTGNVAQNFHMEREDGTDEWVRRPGRMIIRMGYQEKVYPDIDDLITLLIQAIADDRYILKQRVTRLKHKMYGIRYHLENFVEQEDKKISEFNSYYQAPDHDSVFFDPKLVYEIESFLFQVKSTLDVLAQIISMIYRLQGIGTYSNDGNIIINKLREGRHIGQAKVELSNIILNHKTWVTDIVDMRDEVTHFSDLQGFLCFIQHAWIGGKSADISYPSMPDGQRARRYMERIWTELMSLVSEVIPYLLLQIKKAG
jgi:hypothetical protein